MNKTIWSKNRDVSTASTIISKTSTDYTISTDEIVPKFGEFIV